MPGEELILLAILAGAAATAGVAISQQSEQSILAAPPITPYRQFDEHDVWASVEVGWGELLRLSDAVYEWPITALSTERSPDGRTATPVDVAFSGLRSGTLRVLTPAFFYDGSPRVIEWQPSIYQLFSDGLVYKVLAAAPQSSSTEATWPGYWLLEPNGAVYPSAEELFRIIRSAPGVSLSQMIGMSTPMPGWATLVYDIYAPDVSRDIPFSRSVYYNFYYFAP